ncbi:hypothetical protein [Niallia taxi]|uniref:hypothetical protein n=1 Tax=Niallia taxi TaxID=2499688 RepID=UPI0015F537DB|nr:hypothetical protein [Niallia taxi]
MAFLKEFAAFHKAEITCYICEREADPFYQVEISEDGEKIKVLVCNECNKGQSKGPQHLIYVSKDKRLLKVTRVFDKPYSLSSKAMTRYEKFLSVDVHEFEIHLGKINRYKDRENTNSLHYRLPGDSKRFIRLSDAIEYLIAKSKSQE